MKLSTMARSSFLEQMIAVLIFFLLACANASSMAAWVTPFGTSLIIHNSSTGIISSSICNNSALVFPVDPPNVLEVGIVPFNGTSLAATGYYDGQTSWASVFYLGEDLNIVNTLYACDNSTGTYRRQSTYIIQMVPSSEKTTLAVVPQDGDIPTFMLAYSDPMNHIHQAIGNSQGWNYAGVISQDNGIAGHTLGAASSASSSGGKFSIIVTPRGTQNIEVMDSDGDDDWHITTFPQSLIRHHSQEDPPDSYNYSSEAPSFTLPGWTGHPGALGVALDSDYKYHVFYIGSDRRLHHAATGPPEMWFLMPDQETAFWPLADEPDADFAFVSDPDQSTMNLYYMSNGALIEVRFEDGKWQVAIPVGRAGLIEGSNDSPNPGLMYGLAFGIAFGAVLVIAIIIGVIFYFKQRAQAKKRTSEQSEEMKSYDQSQPPPTSSSGQTKSGGTPTYVSEYIAEMREQHNPDVDARPRDLDDSDSDGEGTVLSERWNKKPGGPGFEHVKPYPEADFGSSTWRENEKRARRVSMTCVGDLFKPASSLPPKSKTTGHLPDSKSTTDLPDRSSDDSFSLPIQNFNESSP